MLRKPMTPTERRLFKEAVIREYKLKYDVQKQSLLNSFLRRLKMVMPINIIMGIIACALLVILNGWRSLAFILLYGVIWLTLISTILSAFIKTK